MGYTMIFSVLAFLFMTFRPFEAAIVNCPETDEEDMEAEEVKEYLQMRCDKVCRKEKGKWNPDDIMENDYVERFDKYDRCFRTCVVVLVAGVRGLNITNVPKIKRPPKNSEKELEKAKCTRMCSKKVSRKKQGSKAIRTIEESMKSRSVMKGSVEMSVPACKELCQEIVENIANQSKWTMYFPAQIPRNIDSRVLAKLKHKRESLQEEAEMLSDIYCTRVAMQLLKGKEISTRVSMEQLHYRCTHVEANLPERDPYYCILYLKSG